MKRLKYLFLMAVPVVLLSCGQSNTQSREDDEGGMGTRDRDRDYENVQRSDPDRNPDLYQDTSMYRSGSPGSGGMMGTQQDHSDTSMYRSGSPGSGGMMGTQHDRSDTSGYGSGSQGSRYGSQGSDVDTSKSTTRDNTKVNPR